MTKYNEYVILSKGGKMKVRRKKVKVNYDGNIFIGYLLDESDKKFIVTNEKGNIEMHYPKKNYTYTIVEDK